LHSLQRDLYTSFVFDLVLLGIENLQDIYLPELRKALTGKILLACLKADIRTAFLQSSTRGRTPPTAQPFENDREGLQSPLGREDRQLATDLIVILIQLAHDHIQASSPSDLCDNPAHPIQITLSNTLLHPHPSRPDGEFLTIFLELEGALPFICFHEGLDYSPGSACRTQWLSMGLPPSRLPRPQDKAPV
jgi:hypothetical protein